MMNEQTKKELKETVTQELHTTKKRMERLENELKPLRKSCAYDDAEYAFLSEDRAMKQREFMQLQRRYEELQDALERLDRDQYGICEMCDEEIEEERLRLAPAARLCIECLRESQKS